MEIQDLTYLKGQLKKEYEEICKTEFWKDYQNRLQDERKSASRLCETELPEKVQRHQGFVRGIDTALGLHLRILEITPRKSTGGII